MSKQLNPNQVFNKIEEIADGVITPTGEITVEIKDERGKTVDKETKPNFIAKTWQIYAKALLRQQWMAFDGYNVQFTGQDTVNVNNAMWPSGRATLPVLPISHIACWNDTTAEDAVNEHSLLIPPTGIIAWASRYPSAVPGSGRRGHVDSADSITNDGLVRHAFNWTTNQGNGTYQSVGWTMLGAPGLPNIQFGTTQRVAVDVNYTAGTVIPSATSLVFGAPWIDPATGIMYTLAKRQSSTLGMKIVSSNISSLLSTTGLTTLGTKAVAATTLTDVSGVFNPPSSISTGYSHAVHGRVGAATVFSWAPSSNAHGTTCRWGVIDDAATVHTTYTLPLTGAPRACVIGSEVYMGLFRNTAADATTIYKYTASTGALVTSFTPDATALAHLTEFGLTSPTIAEMTTDGTHLYVMFGQTSGAINGPLPVLKLDTTGALVEIVGNMPYYRQSLTPNETMTSPYSGSTNYYTNLWTNQYDFGPISVDGPSSYGEDIRQASISYAYPWTHFFTPGDTNNSPAWMFLFMYDGDLWTGSNLVRDSATTQRVNFARMFGNLGSRVLLGTSKTKSVGQSMEIKYDINLPGWF